MAALTMPRVLAVQVIADFMRGDSWPGDDLRWLLRCLQGGRG
jgi:hypothetical protein